MNDFDYIRIETADDDNNGTDQNVPPHCCLAECSTICYEHPHPEMYEVVVYDSYGPTTGCIIISSQAVPLSKQHYPQLQLVYRTQHIPCNIFFHWISSRDKLHIQRNGTRFSGLSRYDPQRHHYQLKALPYHLHLETDQSNSVTSSLSLSLSLDAKLPTLAASTRNFSHRYEQGIRSPYKLAVTPHLPIFTANSPQAMRYKQCAAAAWTERLVSSETGEDRDCAGEMACYEAIKLGSHSGF
ncbi:hypothetical protein Bca4012_084628 [Brassica carinata]